MNVMRILKDRMLTLLWILVVLAGIVLLLASPNLRTALIIGFLLAGFAAFSYQGYRKLSEQAMRDLSRIEKLSAASSTDALWQELEKKPLSNEILDQAMKDYLAAFMKHPVSRIYHPRLPSSAFLNDRVLSRAVDLSLHQTLPNILVGTGILFTFLGITLALSTASGALIGASPESMNGALQDLFSSVSIKFITSIAGLASSIVYTFSEKHRTSRLKDQLHRGCRSLDDSWPPLNFEETLLDTVIQGNDPETGRRMGEASEALARAGDQMGPQLAKLVETQSRMTPEALGDRVGEVIRDHLGPVFADIRDELKALRAIKADQGQEILQQLVTSLRVEVLEPMAGKLDQSAEVTRQAGEAVGQLNETLSTTLVETVRELKSASGVIQEFQRSTMAELAGFANNLDSTLTEFARGMDETLSSFRDDTLAAFRDSSAQAAATFRGIREELQEALKTQAEVEEERLGRVFERLQTLLDQVERTFTSQMEELKAVGSESTQMLRTARAELESSIQAVRTTLEEVSSTTREELATFRTEYQQNLAAFFTAQNTLLEEALGRQKEGLSEVVNSLREVFEAEATRQVTLREELDAGMKKVTQFAAEIGLNSTERLEQLRAITREVGTHAYQIAERYGDLTASYESLTRQNNEQIAQHLKAIETRQQQFNQDIDHALARVSTELVTAATVLAEAKLLPMPAGRA